jgi:hypothetical protein
MSKLKVLNEALRSIKTTKIEVTVTTQSGQTETRQFSVRNNKISKIAGSGLSSKHLYDLIKTGATESVDAAGTTYSWKILTTNSDQPESSPEVIEAASSIDDISDLQKIPDAK